MSISQFWENISKLKNCAFNNRKPFPSTSRMEAARLTVEKLSPLGCVNSLDFSESDHCYEFFRLPFSVSDLQGLIDSTKVYQKNSNKKNSAPGPDLINNYILKLLPEVAIKDLVDSFNLMMVDGSFPLG